MGSGSEHRTGTPQAIDFDTHPFLHDVVVEGCRIQYFDRGCGTVLVLIHGMFGDHLDWEPVLVPLSKSNRVIAVDLPGFGESEKPDEKYDKEFFVSKLRGFLNAIGVQRPVLVGNSFGGEIAILYTLEYSNDVAALVLVSSGGLRFYDESERKRIREAFSISNLRALSPAAHALMFSRVMSDMGPHSAHSRRYLDRQNARLKRADYPEYTVAIHRSIETAFSLYFDEDLRRLSVPVLLAWGEGDAVFPVELAKAALGKLPNGQLALIPGGGHALQLERPAEFVSVLSRFLSGVET